MTTVNFADIAQPFISFDKTKSHHNLVLKLIDTPWIQRLRDIAQTGNTNLVYMFSEHSRFGHSLGVAYLAVTLIDILSQKFPKQVNEYRDAIAAAALLHDIGHIAPGSHTAYKTFFPSANDCHEEVGLKIIQNDNSIFEAVNQDKKLISKICGILEESSELPPWTWQIISGGGWNVDRGNWCLVDSTMAGVSYGKYNVPAILESIILTPDGRIAVSENRLDALTHFAVARHSMYRQVYQHRVLLAADTINQAIAKRAKIIRENLDFCDPVMKRVLSVSSPLELELSDIYSMTESWWRYHITRWSNDSDSVIKDLCKRFIERKLFKTIRLSENEDKLALIIEAKKKLVDLGFDPEFYLHEISSFSMHKQDNRDFMMVLLDSGEIKPLAKVEPLIHAMLTESDILKREWLAVPAEVKIGMGRKR